MLACQLVMWVLAAVKLFDTVALHARQSLREAMGALRWGREQGLAE